MLKRFSLEAGAVIADVYTALFMYGLGYPQIPRTTMGMNRLMVDILRNILAGGNVFLLYEFMT
jgi:hypothetical protein